MTHDELRYKLAKIAAQNTPADEGLRALARALTGQPDPGLDCEACRDLLSEYVHAESSGLDAAARYPTVRAHLLLCAECEREYINQLDLAWRLARDELPRPGSRPVPDLAFLRPPRTARQPERLPANPAAWWTNLRAVVGGVRTVLISFVDQGTFQPVAALEDQGFQRDEERGLEHRRLLETALPQVPEGALSVTASRREGADVCELVVWIDSPHWEPGDRRVRLLYSGGIRESRTDPLGRACFSDVPVAALPELQVEIPDVGD
jgi:hypothetical protein